MLNQSGHSARSDRHNQEPATPWVAGSDFSRFTDVRLHHPSSRPPIYPALGIVLSDDLLGR
jgi:hypothetical protein